MKTPIELETDVIKSDGSLFAPAGNVTWQTFLQLSRSLNSKKKGWNSKTNWVGLGLEKLAPKGEAADFISVWSGNSQEPAAPPKPREKDFQLDLRESMAQTGVRGKVKAPDNDLGIKQMPKKPEDNLNWWLYMRMRHDGLKITFELPLCETADNLLRADLVHFLPEYNFTAIRSWIRMCFRMACFSGSCDEKVM